MSAKTHYLVDKKVGNSLQTILYSKTILCTVEGSLTFTCLLKGFVTVAAQAEAKSGIV